MAAALDYMALLKQERALARAKARGDAASTTACTPTMPAAAPSTPSAITTSAAAAAAAPAAEDESSGAPVHFLRSLDEAAHRCGATNHVYYVAGFCSREQSRSMLQHVYANEDRWVALRNRRLQCYGGKPPASAESPFAAEPLPGWASALCDGLVEAGVFPPAQRPNHILVNEYQYGQGILAHTDGPRYCPRTATLSLSLKDDGEGYCGGEAFANKEEKDLEEGEEDAEGALMRFTKRQRSHEIGERAASGGEFVLRRRSLLVFHGDAYLDYTHGIDDNCAADVPSEGLLANGAAARADPGRAVERPQTRVSFTFRRINAVLGLSSGLGVHRRLGEGGDDQ
jgi:alkylated DNA repair protein alkB family protein 6